jgi:[Skp1-protein]-hydroxyproline N-acetylglucosaminyltransferase
MMAFYGKTLDVVPFDPNLSHLFQGEEVLYSARLWTYGYDFYTPNRKIAWHHYVRKGKPHYWEDHPEHNECRKLAEKRVRFILQLAKKSTVQEDFLRELHYYGLGKDRTLESFWKKAGVTFKGKDKMKGDVKQIC